LARWQVSLEWNIDADCKLTTYRDLFFILFIVDRVGRIKPLLFGTIGITLALVCEAIIGSRIKEGDTHNNGLAIAGVFFIFCVSVVSLPLLYILKCC
jgi:chromate transport protein ChrA